MLPTATPKTSRVMALAPSLTLRPSMFPLGIPHNRTSAPLRRSRATYSPLIVRAAAFDNLSRGLEKAWDMVRKDGKLTSDNIKEPLREIRRALLEADVSLPVVRRFVSKVEKEALGAKVTKGVSPDQQLVKVVYDQLRELMGGSAATLAIPSGGDPQVILMAGLQGTGKTTAAGKLALFLKKKGQKVLLVATDVYRPAAIDQLVTLGQRIDVPVFELGTKIAPPVIATQALAKAKAEGFDAVIVDTAGRLQIDENMMQELQDVKTAVKPTDVLLVVDAMTGQEAAALVKSFDDVASITGAVLTKLDGDSRGGAALSVKEVSGKPIKFVGTGEKMEALEPFYPDRMASRILGMGDVVTLVEKAEEAIKADEAEAAIARMMTAKFDFNDFLQQYKLVNGMGSMTEVMKMIPGMNKITEKQLSAIEKKYKRYESMIGSMTKQERELPELLAKSQSRRRRIARGSGYEAEDVTELVAMFTGMRAQLQTMSRMMALGGGGMPGQMSDEDMMAAVLGGTGPRKVTAGMVRRKKKRASEDTGSGSDSNGASKAMASASAASAS
jgi:signal recognition particle subunit SRP54